MNPMGIGFGVVTDLDYSVRNKMGHRKSDFSKVLHRYFSLTILVGGLCVIQQGLPENRRINNSLICELPDRQNS